jgi:hypothetical protein
MEFNIDLVLAVVKSGSRPVWTIGPDFCLSTAIDTERGRKVFRADD